MTAEHAPEQASRRHRGGKLAFRRRVRGVADSAGLPFVLGGEDPPALADLLPAGRSFAAVELEVGPGKGAFMLAATAASPDVFLVGIEASPAYGKVAAARLQKTGRENGVVLVDDARLYLEDRVPDGALRRIHAYFPDPWPKRRHRKRRFFREGVPDVLHRALAPGGLVLVATDDAAYAGQIARVMGSTPRFARDRGEEERLAALPPGHGFGPTNFLDKYVEEGRIIRRYAFRRVQGGA